MTTEQIAKAALDMAADEWLRVRVEGRLAAAALMAYSDRIRAIPVADVLAKVGVADAAPDADPDCECCLDDGLQARRRPTQ